MPATACSLRAQLEEAGISFVHGEHEPCIAALAFFDRVDEALVEQLRCADELRLMRVIAIATTPDALVGNTTWELLAAGAADVLACDDLQATTHAITARVTRWAEVDRLVESPIVRSNMIGSSPGFVRLLRHIVEAAAFTSASVLLLGESGTGKEQVARLVHTLDRRPDKKELVTLDCTTVVPELSGSEFFGHERGAFTGAIAQRDGVFALADKGTLFLDEVGELPPALQAQLLRAVQEQTFKRVGGNHWFNAKFRLITATNRELSADVANSAFRRDFYHRITTWVFRLPPLRERVEDIVPLAEHFAREYFGVTRNIAFDDRVREFLHRLPYAGNIRELRQLVIRLCGRHVGDGPITVGDIPTVDLPKPDMRPDGALAQAAAKAVLYGIGLKEIGRVARDAAIRAAIETGGHNVQQAAKLLKVTDRALQMELAKRDN